MCDDLLLFILIQGAVMDNSNVPAVLDAFGSLNVVEVSGATDVDDIPWTPLVILSR